MGSINVILLLAISIASIGITSQSENNSGDEGPSQRKIIKIRPSREYPASAEALNLVGNMLLESQRPDELHIKYQVSGSSESTEESSSPSLTPTLSLSPEKGKCVKSREKCKTMPCFNFKSFSGRFGRIKKGSSSYLSNQGNLQDREVSKEGGKQGEASTSRQRKGKRGFMSNLKKVFKRKE